MPESENPQSETSTNVPIEPTAKLEDLKQKVRWAAEISSAAGEFKEIAFSKVLDRLFEETLALAPQGPNLEVSKSREEVPARRRPTGGVPRRTPMADGATLDRVRPMLEAAPDLTTGLATKIAQAPAKVQIYSALQFAADKFGIARLTTAEIREVLRQVLRIGMPDGTLRGILSRAAPSEIGRVQSGDGETAYQLMLGGKELLEKAFSSEGGPSAPS